MVSCCITAACRALMDYECGRTVILQVGALLHLTLTPLIPFWLNGDGLQALIADPLK